MEILKRNYGYLLRKKRINEIIIRCISIFVLLFLMFGTIFTSFESFNFVLISVFKTIVCIIILFLIYERIFFYTEIKIFNDKIVFYICSKPLKLEKIEVKKNNIREISINNEVEYEEGGITYYYNLDLIDNDFNAYRLDVLQDYNTIYNFGIRISKILNMDLVDRNDMEGYGNVYNKRII